MIFIEYGAVTDRLYFGSYPQEPEDFKYIKNKLGLNVILSLQEREDLILSGLKPDIAHRIALSENLKWKNIPIKDFNPGSIYKKIPETVAFIKKYIEEGVYVHCTMGLNRSASIVAAYLIIENNLGSKEAIELVRKNRPNAILYESLIEKIAKKRDKLKKGTHQISKLTICISFSDILPLRTLKTGRIFNI